MGDLSSSKSTSKMGRLRALLPRRRTSKLKETAQDSSNDPSSRDTVSNKPLPETPIHSTFANTPTQNTTTDTATTTTITPPHMSSKRDSLSPLATSPASQSHKQHAVLDR